MFFIENNFKFNNLLIFYYKNYLHLHLYLYEFMGIGDW